MPKFINDAVPPEASSPKVSSPSMKSPDMKSPNPKAPTGDSLLDKALDYAGLETSEGGSA